MLDYEIAAGCVFVLLFHFLCAYLQFVEVKGPGDRLSHKQIVWLSDLARWQCQVEVCRVKGGRLRLVT